jgi:hypothetical protein
MSVAAIVDTVSTGASVAAPMQFTGRDGAFRRLVVRGEFPNTIDKRSLPLSRRIRSEPVRELLPPPKVYTPLRATRAKRRRQSGYADLPNRGEGQCPKVSFPSPTSRLSLVRKY